MQRDTRIEISFSSIEVANLILNTVGVDTIQVTLQDRDTSQDEIYSEAECIVKELSYPPPMICNQKFIAKPSEEHCKQKFNYVVIKIRTKEELKLF